eukprot:4175371-Prymnesium_polylepis.1
MDVSSPLLLYSEVIMLSLAPSVPRSQTSAGAPARRALEAGEGTLHWVEHTASAPSHEPEHRADPLHQ